MQLTLIEATGKKTAFLHHLVDRLSLSEVEIIHARAEEVGSDLRYRESYDWVLARAVARMPVLAEYTLPLARLGGRVVALKGEGAHAEVNAAQNAIRLLGGRLAKVEPVELPHVRETHHLVVIEKRAATPDKYPRRPGMPAKRPLL